MASGNTLQIFGPLDNEPPSASFATLDVRNLHPVLDFDGAADESAVFSGILPRSYAGGGVTVYIHFAATSATSGNVVWISAFERIGDGSQDIDSDSFATGNTVTHATSGTSGNVEIASIAHTDGSQMDSIAAGELFRIKITRDADNASDTVDATDVELLGIEIKET